MAKRPYLIRTSPFFLCQPPAAPLMARRDDTLFLTLCLYNVSRFNSYLSSHHPTPQAGFAL